MSGMKNGVTRLALTGLMVGALVSCGAESGQGFKNPLRNLGGAKQGATTLVARDVEAPDAFQRTENGIWDGTQDLGGVWVSHADVTTPQRVIIRREGDNRFVIGSLFPRTHGASATGFEISSDAAAALGMTAGSPAMLGVTALRREDQEQGIPSAPSGSADSAVAAALALPANASPEEIVEQPVAVVATPAQETMLDKPYIQIGIFSIEANARRTANLMRDSGIVPVVTEGSGRGKPFWRVTVGPAATVEERAELLETVKAKGFGDAYFVSK